MDYDALRLFLNLSRTLHFLRSSRETHVSPSALSRAIQRLEKEVGWPLFERDRRTVRLTAEGARFAEHARQTLDDWERLRRELRGSGETLSGTIALFASVTATQSFLPGILSGFREQYPDIHIKLETGYAADALAMLEQGLVDVTVAAIPPRIPPALVARVVTHTPLLFVAPAAPGPVQRLTMRRPLPWPEIPIVLPASGLARTFADRWFKRKRITPLLYSEVPGSEATMALVALGAAVGIVPRLVMDRSPLRPDVRALEVEPDLGEFRVGFCTQRRKLKSPLVRAFWNVIRDIAPPQV
ncbi:MAG TPA: HTH-type transcriptional activator IlvY [Polyangia bacterium]|jgi:LysR family positive regulator for ilvC|nr:HTH-type transcriptional activator IlvY [Polyangia bacterium]